MKALVRVMVALVSVAPTLSFADWENRRDFGQRDKWTQNQGCTVENANDKRRHFDNLVCPLKNIPQQNEGRFSSGEQTLYLKQLLAAEYPELFNSRDDFQKAKLFAVDVIATQVEMDRRRPRPRHSHGDRHDGNMRRDRPFPSPRPSLPEKGQIVSTATLFVGRDSVDEVVFTELDTNRNLRRRWGKELYEAELNNQSGKSFGPWQVVTSRKVDVSKVVVYVQVPRKNPNHDRDRDRDRHEPPKVKYVVQDVYLGTVTINQWDNQIRSGAIGIDKSYGKVKRVVISNTGNPATITGVVVTEKNRSAYYLSDLNGFYSTNQTKVIELPNGGADLKSISLNDVIQRNGTAKFNISIKVEVPQETPRNMKPWR